MTSVCIGGPDTSNIDAIKYVYIYMLLFKADYVQPYLVYAFYIHSKIPSKLINVRHCSSVIFEITILLIAHK